MKTVIAEGSDATEIQQGIAQVSAGEVFELQLVFDGPLTSAEKTDSLAYLRDNGIYPSKFYQDRNNTLHIEMVKPEGVAMPSLALLIGGTILAGFVAWRLTTEDIVTSITDKIVPVALIGAGLLVLLKIVDKVGTRSHA